MLIAIASLKSSTLLLGGGVWRFSVPQWNSLFYVERNLYRRMTAARTVSSPTV